jgi:hypothetical protein
MCSDRQYGKNNRSSGAGCILRWRNSLMTACFGELLQLRVLRFGFLQDGDVGVGVFPEGKPLR